MRVFLVAAAGAAILAGAATAHAEKRIFVIANNPDGYGVDRCLSTGANCGNAIATAYCRTREFDKAVSFRKIDRGDITGAIPINASLCRSGVCDNFVAIECAR